MNIHSQREDNDYEFLLDTGDGNGVLLDTARKEISAERPLDMLLRTGGWKAFDGNPEPVMQAASDAKPMPLKTIDPWTLQRIMSGDWTDLRFTHPDGTITAVPGRESSSSSSA
jgi:hypothetical protein